MSKIIYAIINLQNIISIGVNTLNNVFVETKVVLQINITKIASI